MGGNQMKCTCGREVRTHPAGACLDRLFIEKVMEWKLAEIIFHSGCGSQKGKDWVDKEGEHKYMDG